MPQRELGGRSRPVGVGNWDGQNTARPLHLSPFRTVERSAQATSFPLFPSSSRQGTANQPAPANASPAPRLGTPARNGRQDLFQSEPLAACPGDLPRLVSSRCSLSTFGCCDPRKAQPICEG